MNIFKIHRNFLLNKICIIVIFLITVLSALVNFASIFSINNEYNWFEGNLSYINYIDNLILFFKLITINLICFIWSNSFNKDIDSYHLLIVGFKHIKYKYVSSKILILIIFTFLLNFTNIFISSIIAGMCCSWYYFNKIIVDLFVVMFLISIIYGLLSAIISMLINSNYVYLISSGLLVLSEFLTESKSISSNLYLIFFPNLYELNYNFVLFSILHLVILSCLYFFFASVLYVKNVKY